MSVPTLRQRASGVLLHPTSLPGPHGSGDIGDPARRFVDFLAAASQRWWQMLPVGPPGYGESPYSAQSAFAGSPLLVSIEDLARDRRLDVTTLAPAEPLRGDRIEFARMESHRFAHLRRAFERLGAEPDRVSSHRRFCRDNEAWLDDFALFRALKRAHGGGKWTGWESGVRDRRPAALQSARTELAGDIAFEKFVQHVFDDQWGRLRDYAAQRGVGLIGDVPIFVAHDSAEVWQNPDLFFLGPDGEPTCVAGVPPDYFSRTGQRWGNPLYRWKRMKETGYAWWIARLRSTLRRFDAVRLDHFIGFHRYWRIPADEPTAVRGRWVKGPGADFFDAVQAALGDLPFIAEDLGEVTPAVYALRDRYGLAGIKVLQFAFGTDSQASTFLPHNYPRRSVAFTGTHDNDTTAGWFHDPGGEGSGRTVSQAAEERSSALRYLGTSGQEIHWDMVRAVIASVARLSLFPLQDLLGLGSSDRMNRPGRAEGNWTWRAGEDALGPDLATRLRCLTHTYERGGRDANPRPRALR
jgi:4-alpha-glucanotransferase